MKIFKLGEKSKGVCNDCKKVVPTTFKLCTVPLSSGKGSVDDYGGYEALEKARKAARLIDEPERCAVLRQRLFERQQAFFSPEVMGAQYASLLEGLFEGKGKNADRGRPGRILIPWRMRLRHSRLGRLRTERIKRRTGRRG